MNRRERFSVSMNPHLVEGLRALSDRTMVPAARYYDIAVAWLLLREGMSEFVPEEIAERVGE